MTSVSWEQVIPQFEHLFSAEIKLDATNKYDSIKALQPRLCSTLTHFTRPQSLSNLLFICAPDNKTYRDFVTTTLHHMEPNLNLVSSETMNQYEVFGCYHTDQQGTVLKEQQGLLEKAGDGLLILPLSFLLCDPRHWHQIKTFALGGDIHKPLLGDKYSSPAMSINSNAKIIFVGDRDQLADLDEYDTSAISSLSLFSEVELECKLSKENFQHYIAYINDLAKLQEVSLANKDAYQSLLTAGTRECEEQSFVPLCPNWINRQLNDALLAASGPLLTASDFKAAFEKRYFQESYLVQRALDDILDGQVVIQTTGQQVGQVNGLTVIDIPGHPVSYGEPARISCVVHFGDGDISDVERKVDLAGNIHAKGMMIMQAYISSELKLDEPLPFSASIAFEQSYCEVDGDSASLAEFCALSSALSQYPINQNIAVTGAMDQFGQVQAVGGLNEKIEGFFYVCQHQGLDGKQGVIIPKANLKHLILRSNLVDAIKNQQFHIWSVENVDQALQILLEAPFKGSEDSVLDKITQRIDQLNEPNYSQSFLDRLLRRQ